MRRLWEIFPCLCAAIQATHDAEKMRMTDHDFPHALRVAVQAHDLIVATYPRTASLAFIAGICHNADRVVQMRREMHRYSDPPDSPVEQLLREEWLPHLDIQLGPDDLDVIVDAVLRHGGANCVEDHMILRALRDADRLVNVAPDVIMRAGKQPVPPVDSRHFLDDPNATYQRPGSVLWDIDYMSRRWDPEHPDHDGRYCLTLPQAVQIGRPRFKFLRDYVAMVLAAWEAEGLKPFPAFN